MCGICGKFMLDREAYVPEVLVKAMADAITHRGPDDEGFYISGQIGLGFRRLSIIDLSGGHQPLSNEDGTIWIVFNGEIYNYQALRSELITKGHAFKTKSDTEVIIHLYEEFGPDCVQHLRGMFAFAIWNRNTKTLFVARDRLGIKPLYYKLTPDRLLFGSEIKAVLAHGGINPEFNRAALPEYLAFGYLSGEESFYAGI